MKKDSDFFMLNETSRVSVRFDEHELQLVEGSNLAAALLEAGVTQFRRTSSGSPRAPFCMMGACFDCLVEIDGQTKQACMERVVAGMSIKSGGTDDGF